MGKSIQGRNTVHSIYKSLMEDKTRHLSKYDRLNNTLLYFSLLKAYREDIPKGEYNKLQNILNSKLNELIN